MITSRSFSLWRNFKIWNDNFPFFWYHIFKIIQSVLNCWGESIRLHLDSIQNRIFTFENQDSFQGHVGPPLLVHFGDVQPARGCLQQREWTTHAKRTGGGVQLSCFEILQFQDFVIGVQIDDENDKEGNFRCSDRWSNTGRRRAGKKMFFFRSQLKRQLSPL